MCAHVNVDHHGSNDQVHNTFCKDCSTFFEAVPRSAYLDAKAMQEAMPNPIPEEAAMLMRVMDHRRISRAELELAINIFIAKAHSLEGSKDGYSLSLRHLRRISR
eukprot:4039318-Karenia_brevis.AAC.1